MIYYAFICYGLQGETNNQWSQLRNVGSISRDILKGWKNIINNPKCLPYLPQGSEINYYIQTQSQDFDRQFSGANHTENIQNIVTGQFTFMLTIFYKKLRYEFTMHPANSIPDCEIKLTQHARKRAKQRFSWNASTLERMSKKAFAKGLRRADTKGLLKIYLDHLFEKYRNSNNLRIYGETIFVFKNHSLLTVWQLPVQFKQLAKVFQMKLRISEFAA